MPVRPAIPADAEALARLSGQLGYPTTAAEMTARVRALANSPTHAVLVAEEAGVVLGWVHVCRRLLLVSEFAEIMGLVVDETKRSNGLGAKLLAAAEGWARGAGLPLMRVRSNVVRDRAHGFYARHGYTVLKRQAVFDKTL